MKRHPRESLSRKAMKLLCTLLGLLLAVMLGTTFALQHLLDQVNYTNSPRPLSENNLSVYSAVRLGSLQPKPHTDVIGGTGSDIINILLIGQDAREGDSQPRSDSMILCTFHKETKTLTMTSFLRDLYVKIPGFHDNRINAAYAGGGTRLLDKTLEENFGLYIDGNVEVDFDQFAGIIDLLGGVQIQLRQDEANVINQETGSMLNEGLQLLTGEQALTYSRIRKLDLDGDFSRTDRQRKVMAALLDAYKNTRITEMIPLLGKLLPMITTDLNQGQLLLCAMEVLPYLPDAQIISQRIPADGTYTDKTIDGMAVLVADMDAQRQFLRQTLLGT